MSRGVGEPVLGHQHVGAAAQPASMRDQRRPVTSGDWTCGCVRSSALTSTTASATPHADPDDPRIRSRRLASRIAQLAPAATEPTRETLRAWIAQLGLSGWVPGRGLLRTLLETGRVAVRLHGVSPARGQPVFEPVHGEPSPAPLGVYADGTLVGTVAAQDHADVSAILDTGLDLTLYLDEGSADLVVLPPLGELDDE